LPPSLQTLTTYSTKLWGHLVQIWSLYFNVKYI